MPIKVNEFIIKANIIEDEKDDGFSQLEPEGNNISESVKKEIIDECISRMTELLERERSRF
jgi:phosphosulfolactate synthase (CoM biosynthesis protein A)